MIGRHLMQTTLDVLSVRGRLLFVIGLLAIERVQCTAQTFQFIRARLAIKTYVAYVL